MTMHVAGSERPRLRGYSHAAAAALAPGALVLLLLNASSAAGYVSAAIFGTSLLLLFAASGAYHTLAWGTRAAGIARRLDHAAIFVLIAGTITPFCLLAMDLPWGIPVLAVSWSLAAVGIALKVAWPDAPRSLSVGAYLALGWMPLVAAYETAGHLSPVALAGVIGGGLLYTAGGVSYARQWPNPVPSVFGYHEVFHVLVLVACAVHYLVIVNSLLR